MSAGKTQNEGLELKRTIRRKCSSQHRGLLSKPWKRDEQSGRVSEKDHVWEKRSPGTLQGMRPGLLGASGPSQGPRLYIHLLAWSQLCPLTPRLEYDDLGHEPLLVWLPGAFCCDTDLTLGGPFWDFTESLGDYKCLSVGH